MVYLDYSASTPVDNEVVKLYVKASVDYYSKMSCCNDISRKCVNLYNTSILEIAKNLGVAKEEIIFSNGCSDNYRILLDIINSNSKGNKHIIVSKLEEKNMYEFVEVLESNGYAVDYLNNNEDGLIDLEHLQKLIRKDTLIVSVPYVNCDLGIRQPIKSIKQVIKKVNDKVLLFSDLSYAFGKISISFKDIDIAFFRSDNIYGIKGKGLVYKKDNLLLGDRRKIDLPSVVAMCKTVEINNSNIVDREQKVKEIKKKIVDRLEKYEGLLINNTKYSIPYIINVSFMNKYTKDIIDILNDNEIYLSNDNDKDNLSSNVMAVYKDKTRSITSVRISLSHLVSFKEVDYFLDIIDNIFSEDGVNNEEDNSVM